MTTVAVDMSIARDAVRARMEGVAREVELEEVPTPARADEYREKREEVQRLRALPDPSLANLDDFPMIRDDMQDRGLSLQQAVRRIEAAMERLRIKHRVVRRWRTVRAQQIADAPDVNALWSIPITRQNLDAMIEIGLSP